MKVEIKKLGEEVICDALVQVDYLNNPDKLKEVCLSSLKKGDCQIVSDQAAIFHQFSDDKDGHGDGVTGLIVIKESHFHISTWPEEQYIQINVNTCGHIAKPLIALNWLLFEMRVVKSTLQVIERGVLLK